MECLLIKCRVKLLYIILYYIMMRDFLRWSKKKILKANQPSLHLYHLLTYLLTLNFVVISFHCCECLRNSLIKKCKFFLLVVLQIKIWLYLIVEATRGRTTTTAKTNTTFMFNVFLYFFYSVYKKITKHKLEFPWKWVETHTPFSKVNNKKYSKISSNVKT